MTTDDIEAAKITSLLKNKRPETVTCSSLEIHRIISNVRTLLKTFIFVRYLLKDLSENVYDPNAFISVIRKNYPSNSMYEMLSCHYFKSCGLNDNLYDFFHLDMIENHKYFDVDEISSVINKLFVLIDHLRIIDSLHVL